MKAETTSLCKKENENGNLIVHGVKEVADENEEENDESINNFFLGILVD